MANKVQHYRSYTPGAAPTTLLPGELGVNIVDQRMWFGDNASVPVEMEFSSELPTVSLEAVSFVVDPVDGMNHHYHVTDNGVAVYIPDTLPVEHRFQVNCKADTVFVDGNTVPPPPTPETFIITVVPNRSSLEVTLPLSGVHNVNINWGDGIVEEGVTVVNPSHTYTTRQAYDVQITGTADAFKYGGTAWVPQLRVIKQWGDLGITDWSGGFSGCILLHTVSAIDDIFWAAGVVTNTSTLFKECMFRSIKTDTWNLSQVVNSSEMFYFCNLRDSPPDSTNWGISSSNLQINGMFAGCLFPTPPIVGLWDVSGVSNFDYFMGSCESLTSPPDITAWVPSAATNIKRFFYSNRVMAGPLDMSCFSASLLSDVSDCLSYCTVLGLVSGIDTWNVTQLTRGTNFMLQSPGALNTASYDALLIAWSSQIVQVSVNIDFDYLVRYTYGGAAAAARKVLTDALWQIQDGGMIVPNAYTMVAAMSTVFPEFVGYAVDTMPGTFGTLTPSTFESIEIRDLVGEVGSVTTADLTFATALASAPLSITVSFYDESGVFWDNFIFNTADFIYYRTGTGAGDTLGQWLSGRIGINTLIGIGY